MEQKPVYSIDRARINFIKSKDELNEIFKEEIERPKFDDPHRKAWIFCGFRAKTEIGPNEDYLEVLLKHSEEVGKYGITHLELAKDVYYPSREEAIKAFDENRHVKKYSSEFKVICEFYKNPKKSIDPRIIGNEVRYYGNRKVFYIRAYVRLSKVNNEPCVHVEFVFCNASIIRKKLSVSTLQDLHELDLATAYESLYEKFVVPNKPVNLLKLAVDLFTRQHTRLNKLKPLHRAMLDRTAYYFCLKPWFFLYSTQDVVSDSYDGFKHEIDPYSFVDFKHKINLIKKEIKSRKGRRSSFQERVLNLKASKFY
jgi:hypothetical protein